MQVTEDRLLTVPEVAERLRISEYTTRKWLRAGKLHGRRIGGSIWRVSESDIKRFINNGGQDLRSEPTQEPAEDHQ